jgi:hypothetical protein
LSNQSGLIQACPLLLGSDTFWIWSTIVETEWVARLKARVPLLKGAFVKDLVDAFSGCDNKVVIALWTNAQVSLKLFAIQNGVALRALGPQAFRNFLLFR